MDETIAPSLYRTGRGDRAIPLGLGLFTLSTSALLAWATGPFFLPWGAALLGVGMAVATLGFWRAWVARRTVTWDETQGVLEFRQSRVTSVAVADLAGVEVRPAWARTYLRTPGKTLVLSHRIVGVERLLDRVRRRRPDLFPVPEPLRFRASWVGLGTLVLLAAGTAGAGWVLGSWWAPVGTVFGVASALVVLRALWSVPRAFVVDPGRLTVRYLVRRKVWKGPTAYREEAYPAAGAVFFRMRIEFGGRWVTLDEGDLLDPLRPWAGLVVRRLDSSPPV